MSGRGTNGGASFRHYLTGNAGTSPPFHGSLAQSWDGGLEQPRAAVLFMFCSRNILGSCRSPTVRCVEGGGRVPLLTVYRRTYRVHILARRDIFPKNIGTT